MTASAAPGANAAPPPAHTVTNHAQNAVTGTADLVMPDGTPANAQAAIEDFAASLGGGQELYYVKVIHGTDASRHVCRTLVRRRPSLRRLRPRPASWPALDVNCT